MRLLNLIDLLHETFFILSSLASADLLSLVGELNDLLRMV